MLFNWLCIGSKDQSSLVDLVNPLMGSDSNYSLSNGNTYPAITYRGNELLDPADSQMGDGWIYAYDATKIQGIKQTHQPSPWINDYGQFSLCHDQSSNP